MIIPEVITRACSYLQDLLDEWNESTDPEQGDSTGALYLELYVDGSGEIGTLYEDFQNPQFRFHSLVELESYLEQWRDEINRKS